MILIRLSNDAQASVRGNKLIVNGVTVQEFTSEGGRTVALGASTDIQFFPGTIYQVNTKIAIDGVLSFDQLYVRTTLAAFKLGLKVERVEVSASHNEIVVFVTALTRIPFNRMVPLFEIVPVGIRQANEEVNKSDFDTKAKELPVVNFKGYEPGRMVQTQTQAPDPNATKKIDDWMNSADVNPAQIGQSVEGGPPLPTVKSSAQVMAEADENRFV